MASPRSKRVVSPDAAEAHREYIRRSVSFGQDPIRFFCDVLSDETASEKARRQAALELLPYYQPTLAKMGPLLERFAK
jgi:hypothetical protein